jgi:diaminohydroxyphosphoribosylaminopyrimidine deaminase/5-amino-6-(5-phosphoribosylamino)uracil reductase
MLRETSNSQFDRIWMHRALELARNGVGLCSPNPAVGCVILSADGQLAGEGWHEYERRDHAEVVAIRSAGERARGGSAYVTLEPCNHTGRTGPCTEALIAAGVARVVVATEDPNPVVARTGIERLRNSGIAVDVGLCQVEARRLNEGFARWIVTRRPFVHMKVAMTLDGCIAPPITMRTERQPFWMTGDLARAEVQQIRWASDAVLTGVDTVIADDPLLTDRSGRPRRRPLLRVVLDSTLRIPLDSKLVTTAQDDVVIFTVSADAERATALRERRVRVEVLPIRDSAATPSRVPLDFVLDRLGAEQILTVLTETGSRLNTALLAGDLVDRLTAFCSPQILGSDAVSAFGGLSMPVRMEGAEWERVGEDFQISALLRDPWA